MQFTDRAIILSLRRHGESSAIVNVLAQEHGRYAAVVKGISGKSNRGIYQPGNLVLLTWKARLPEQMGLFSAELMESVAAFAVHDAGKLAALTGLAALVETLVPEREPHVNLYHAVQRFMHEIRHDGPWQDAYARFELALLSECGYRLDFSSCAATGATTELVYVSPKSGRAVSWEAGRPYHEKLLPLPQFLLGKGEEISPPYAEILASLRLSGYFLEHWLLAPLGKTLPAARMRLVAEMHKRAPNVQTERPQLTPAEA